MRIQKYIAYCNYCSRREAEQLVKEGRVTVNKIVATIGQDVDETKDTVYIDNKRLNYKKDNNQYFMFYKPRGVITSMKAQDDRSIVADLIKGIKGRVYPVGRLDRDSEGLLILTDNGELSQRLCHPKYHVPKTYRVTIKGEVSDEQLNRIRSGVEIEEEVKTAPAGVYINKISNGKTVLHITLFEGKNREIRKICEELGLDILLLKRIAVGDVFLGNMQPGEYRKLRYSEISFLHALVDLDPPPKPTIKEEEHSFSNLKRRKDPYKSVHEIKFEKELKKEIKKSTKNK